MRPHVLNTNRINVAICSPYRSVADFISLNQCAETIFDIMDWRPDAGIRHLTDKPVGVRHRAADTSLAKSTTGWEPRYSLEKGLRETIDWYVQSHDRGEVRSRLESLLMER